MAKRAAFLLLLLWNVCSSAGRSPCGDALESVGWTRAEKNEIFATKIGLHYVSELVGELPKDSNTVKKKMGIPKEYELQWVSNDPDAHLLATAKNKKGKLQYYYHPKWIEAKKYEKFERVKVFGEALPRIRVQVETDLQSNTLSKERIAAAVVRLLDITQIRIGSEEYVEENESFGLTTLLPEHVEVIGNTVRLRFKGKSGVPHDVKIEDPEVAAVLKEVEKTGSERALPISASDINDYLRKSSGESITAKDFRTWTGTLEAFKVYRARSNLEDAKVKKQTLKDIRFVASQALRNEPATAFKHYIHPKIIDRINSGVLFKSDKTDEAALLEFLEYE